MLSAEVIAALALAALALMPSAERVDDGYAAWSPEGRYLAFDGRFDGRSGLYVADRDTGASRRIAPGDVHAAAWVPDGRSIAFSDARSIAVVPARGGAVLRLA